MNWVADDVSLCALITGKLRVKYMVLNEASDYFGLYSYTNHTLGFLFSLLLLLPLKQFFQLFESCRNGKLLQLLFGMRGVYMYWSIYTRNHIHI